MLTGWIQVFQDAIVHCVQVSDIEGWEEESLGESSREKIFPGIISHEDHTPSCRDMRVGHNLSKSQGRGKEKRMPFIDVSEISTSNFTQQLFILQGLKFSAMKLSLITILSPITRLLTPCFYKRLC